MSRYRWLDFNNGIESDLLGLSICGTLHDEDKGEIRFFIMMQVGASSPLFCISHEKEMQ